MKSKKNMDNYLLTKFFHPNNNNLAISWAEEGVREHIIVYLLLYNKLREEKNIK